MCCLNDTELLAGNFPKLCYWYLFSWALSVMMLHQFELKDTCINFVHCNNQSVQLLALPSVASFDTGICSDAVHSYM